VSLRDQIFATQDIPSETVEINEWGITLEVRGMTGADRTVLLEKAVDGTGQLNLSQIYPEAVIACSYDPETGERVFGAEDRENLLAKSATAIDKIALAALRLSGFTAEASDAAGKGSSTTLTPVSSTN
jgi:hypothetical protein